MRVLVLVTTLFPLVSLASSVSACDRALIENAAEGEGEGEGEGELGAADYCETIAGFFCPYYVRCGRMAVATEEECSAVFLEACNARYEPSYTALQDAGLLSLSADGVEACRAHLDDVACEEQIFDLDGPCAGMWQGAVQAGGACGFDVESFVCAPGTQCTLALDLCGTCELVLADGAACGADGTTCAREASCEDGLCVAKKPVGALCEPDDRCVLGASCQGGVCAGPEVVGVNDSCDQSRRCPYASACIGGVCVRSSELGEPCGDTVACDSGWCSGGTCVALVAQGMPCTASAQCQTGACIESVCREIPGVCFEADAGDEP